MELVQAQADGTRPMIMLGDRRRLHARRPLHADVCIVAPIASRGVALNVSDGGIRVALDEAVPVGDRCHVRLELGGRARTLSARVVWTREFPDAVLVGMEFLPGHGIGTDAAEPV